MSFDFVTMFIHLAWLLLNGLPFEQRTKLLSTVTRVLDRVSHYVMNFSKNRQKGRKKKWNQTQN